MGSEMSGIYFFILFVILIFIVVKQVFDYRKIKQEKRFLEMQNYFTIQYYQVYKRQVDFTKKFRHEIANHKFMVESLIETGAVDAVKEYGENIQNTYDFLKQTGLCSDYIVDAVLYQKKKECEKKGIQLECDLLSFQRGSISEKDIFMLFHGLLSNVIHLVEEDEKKINIVSRNAAGNLLIWISFPAGKGKRSRKANPEWKKIQFLQSITDKYEGSLEMERKDKENCINISLSNSERGGEKYEHV